MPCDVYVSTIPSIYNVSQPYGIAINPDGTFYFSDTVAGTIVKSNNIGTTISVWGNGEFNNPHGVAVDSGGNVYVADFNYNRIRKVTPSGTVSTFAGSGTGGRLDGSGTAARFNNPSGITIDSSDNIYVADTGNNQIRKITPAGVVTTLAGSGSGGFADGSGSAAQFSWPYGIAVDSGGNVYVAEYVNRRIRKITPAGVVTTLAGSGVQGFNDGQGTAAQFMSPFGIAVDSGGNVYVTDSGNNRIRKITPSGDVSTLAGSSQGYTDGSGTSARFTVPTGLAIDSSGNLFVGDGFKRKIRKITITCRSCQPAVPGTRYYLAASGGTVNTTLTSPYSFNFFDLTTRVVYCQCADSVCTPPPPPTPEMTVPTPPLCIGGTYIGGVCVCPLDMIYDQSTKTCIYNPNYIEPPPPPTPEITVPTECIGGTYIGGVCVCPLDMIYDQSTKTCIATTPGCYEEGPADRTKQCCPGLSYNDGQCNPDTAAFAVSEAAQAQDDAYGFMESQAMAYEAQNQVFFTGYD